MNIDFNYLAEALLPTFLRKVKMLAFVRAVIAAEIQKLHSEFKSFAAMAKYKAHITPSVLDLELAVERLTGYRIEIQEKSGIPYDFFVAVDDVNADISAIRSVLSSFKLAGKNFTFLEGSLSYIATWKNFYTADDGWGMGVFFALEIEVTKQMGGVIEFGYPKTYSILPKFYSYIEQTTALELRDNGRAAYNERLQHLKDFVANENEWIDIDYVQTNNSIKETHV